MQNNGRSLEKIIFQILNGLKERGHTEVFQNLRLENKDGRKREIDVFLKTRVNGFEINIAIEVKDCAKPVGVEKIEAFNSKCEGIGSIGRKIFVSSSGYQKGALAAAKRLEIDCLTTSNELSDSISSIVSCYQIDPIFLKNFEKVKVLTDVNGSELVISLKELADIIKIPELLVELAEFGHEHIKAAAILLWLKKSNKEADEALPVPFCVDFKPGKPYLTPGGLINILSITASIFVRFKRGVIPSRQVALKTVGGESKAHFFSVKLNEEKEANIVFGPKNNVSIIEKDQTGKETELKVFCIYDPKTDSFIDDQE